MNYRNIERQATVNYNNSTIDIRINIGRICIVINIIGNNI